MRGSGTPAESQPYGASPASAPKAKTFVKARDSGCTRLDTNPDSADTAITPSADNYYWAGDMPTQSPRGLRGAHIAKGKLQ